MTSGNFTLVPVGSIQINRDERQRTELKDIDELADSIRRLGLINPIVVTPEYVLVAGERRLTAHKQLGFDQIAVQFTEELSEQELHMIELEENIKRSDLHWQDEVRAVAKFDKLKRETEEEWNNEKTAEALGVSSRNVARYKNVNRFLEEGKPEVRDAPILSRAVSFAERAIEREKNSATRDLLKPSFAPVSGGGQEATAGAGSALSSSAFSLTPAEVQAHVEERRAEIFNKSFQTWSKTVLDRPYNLIHCDFPYGVNVGDNLKGQSGAIERGGYADKPEVYWELLETFCSRLDNFCAPSAHLIFWFSMDFYEETRLQLKAAGWVVNPFPIIWCKGNTGMIPDANRGPRRSYETALLATRGDRKIVRAVANYVECPVKKEFHTSEKPKEMLRHYLRMLVDGSTSLLDPTAGSGNAVFVAEELGANWATGLEINAKYAKLAKENLGL